MIRNAPDLVQNYSMSCGKVRFRSEDKPRIGRLIATADFTSVDGSRHDFEASTRRRGPRNQLHRSEDFLVTMMPDSLCTTDCGRKRRCAVSTSPCASGRIDQRSLAQFIEFIPLITRCGPIPKQRPEQQPHPITRMDGSALASYSCGLLLLLLSISSPDVQGMENHV